MFVGIEIVYTLGIGLGHGHAIGNHHTFDRRVSAVDHTLYIHSGLVRNVKAYGNFASHGSFLSLPRILGLHLRNRFVAARTECGQST